MELFRIATVFIAITLQLSKADLQPVPIDPEAEEAEIGEIPELSPIPLVPKFAEALIAELQKQSRLCSASTEMDVKIRQCISNFESNGDSKWFQPNPNIILYSDVDWDNEESFAAYEENIRLKRIARIQGLCSQISGTIDCLSDLKQVFETCGSDVGITGFSLAEVLCQNEGERLNEFNDPNQHVEYLRCYYDEQFYATLAGCQDLLRFKPKEKKDEMADREIEDAMAYNENEDEVARTEYEEEVAYLLGNVCDLASNYWDCFNEIFKAAPPEICDGAPIRKYLNEFYDKLQENAGPKYKNSVSQCLRKPADF